MKLLFEDLNILQSTKEAIKSLGLEELTPIQELSIPIMIEGKDFIGQAQTGTGKTFAFAIPIIENLNSKHRSTQALVLCPTRELSLQVYEQFIKLVKFNKDITVAPIVGGESYDRQFKTLKGKPHVIVGTPGRIIDHMNRGTIDLTNLQILTFDEADEMLKMGFQDDIETILKDTPSDRQTVLFSATIPAEIKKIAKNYQKEVTIVKAEAPTLTVAAITQNYYVVQKRDKTKLVKRILDIESTKSAIIFANTKREVDEITLELRDHGYNADALHGDLKQSQRTYVTNNFRKGDLEVLVATDVAARGLDISGVELVINYELPHENEIYVHRIGRTGRAGLTGSAYSIVTPRTVSKIRELEKFTKTTIKELEVPEVSVIQDVRTNTFITDLVNKANNMNNNYNAVIDQLLEKGLTKDQIINVFLSESIPSVSSYETIDSVKKAQRDRGNNNGGGRNRRNDADYTIFKIGLGRRDRVSPMLLLELLNKNLDVRSGNVGDIKHFDGYTTFQVSNRTAGLVRNKNVNYKKKRLKIEEV